MKPLENKIISHLTLVSSKLSKIEDRQGGSSAEEKEDALWQRWDFNRAVKMVVDYVLKMTHVIGKGALLKLDCVRWQDVYAGEIGSVHFKI